MICCAHTLLGEQPTTRSAVAGSAGSPVTVSRNKLFAPKVMLSSARPAWQRLLPRWRDGPDRDADEDHDPSGLAVRLSVPECEFGEDLSLEQLPSLQFGQFGDVRCLVPLSLDDINLGVDDRLCL
jgi:hypothetical protein